MRASDWTMFDQLYDNNRALSWSRVLFYFIFLVPSASVLADTDPLSSNFTTFVSDLARFGAICFVIGR